jgi:hypothetical protein
MDNMDLQGVIFKKFRFNGLSLTSNAVSLLVKVLRSENDIFESIDCVIQEIKSKIEKNESMMFY